MTSFMVTEQSTGGGSFFAPAATTPASVTKAVKPTSKPAKKVKTKPAKAAKPVKAISLLAKRPKSKSQALAVARNTANNYAIDVDMLSRDIESGVMKIDPKSISQPQNANDQRAVLLRQAGKLARLSKQLELRIFNDKNNKLIYALLNVYQQQSEVVDQIVKLSDLGGRSEKVVDKLIDPFAKEVATMLVGLIHTLGDSLHDSLKEEEVAKARAVITTEIRKMGGELQKSRNDMVARVPFILMDE